jgi:pimeloyl-ACP methyl ester carboxylesterase
VPGAVNALAIAPDGAVWAATSKGLNRFDGSTWTTWTTGHGLPDDFVTAVAVTPDGTVWAGTLRGVAKLETRFLQENGFPGPLFRHTLRFEVIEGIGRDEVTALAIAPDGTAWLGTRGGLTRIQPSTSSLQPFGLSLRAKPPTSNLQPFGLSLRAKPPTSNLQTFRQSNSGLTADQVSALAIAPDGAVWVGTETRGLARFDGRRWLAFSKKDGLAGDFVNAVTDGPDGRVWVGTEDGLSVLDGLRGRIFTTADGLPDRRVRAVAVGPDGMVWVGTPRGAARLGVGVADPHPQPLSLEGRGEYITSVAVGSGGVWFGGPSGVSRIMEPLPPLLPPRYPVVFVHGWHGPVNAEDSQLRFLRRWLERDGFQVFYATGIDSNLTLDQNAVRLRDFIAQVKAKTGVEKVHLVGHSMGGLNVRAYVESALYQDDVASVTTLGSPHAGVFLWRDFLVREIARGSTEPSARELLPEHMTLFNQVHALPDGVPYYLIAGDLAQQEPLKFLDFWPPGDGIISAYSALGLKVWPGKTAAVTRILTPAIHGWTAGSIALGLSSYLWPDDVYRTTLRNAWVETLPQVQNLREGLNKALLQSPLTIPGPGTPGWVSNPPPALNRTPAIFGDLAPGQVVSHTLTIDAAAAARFTLIWRTGQIGLTLRDPAGRDIDPAEARRDPAIEHFSLEADTFANLAVYSVQNPQPGTWTMILDGRDLRAETLPQVQNLREGLAVVDYAAYVELDSRLRLDVGLDAGLYRPGQPMRVRATLRDGDRPVTGAAVTAEALSQVQNLREGPNLREGRVVLFDDGDHGDGRANDGVYANELPAPAAGGYYPVTVAARGPLPHPPPQAREGRGGGFARELSVFAVVSPESARLTGRYADRREDTDGDGHFERLVIEVGVEARQPGDFAVAVRLTANDHEVARTVSPVHLESGTQSVAVPLPARQFLVDASDGPYDLAEVTLMDTSGAAIIVDRAENVYRTPAYKVRDFDSRHENEPAMDYHYQEEFVYDWLFP